MKIYEKIIAVTNRHLCKGDFLAQVERICSVRVSALILREKDLSESEYKNLAAEVMPICEMHHVRFIAHNFINAARDLHCKNIHLPVANIKDVQDFEIIGASCHSLLDIMEAQERGAKYVILGNIYETDCKKGLPGKGLNLLREAAEMSSIPVYAIGGVTVERMNEIISTGAAGGCMMSGLMKL